ncbi:STAS domain-containing protein (plasmid) [Halorarum halophilum]|uniref:STAS domain-containing protein n=1 Tax=Halorarum halophilum TaxID=2743090 RepID=A0A7D5KP37_9EURY|nr:STAS domain-containing protein [Halobaculum halophilum]QLG29875.1 STAS domain-containing protein [Halobaculum halophilum]
MNDDTHLSLMRVGENMIASLPPHPSDSTIDELQERVLTRLNQTDAERINGVILDVESVQTVDSFFARTIVETAKMVELMGVRPVLVGISPPIAITATELGFDLGNIDTALNTDTALDMLSDDIQ